MKPCPNTEPFADKETIRVLSLGAGVQSSALCLLYEKGVLPDPPDFAVFADTKSEPEEVYSFLKELQGIIKSFPIYVASKGDLKEFPHKIPLFLKHENGKRGMGWRQCTNEFKIQVVNQKIRKILGYKPRERWRHHIEIIMGISYDERSREKIAMEKWRTNHYPLIEKKISRQDCLDFCKKVGVTPPRSACIMCPYRSKDEWQHMKENYPKDFESACRYDEKVRYSVKRMGKSGPLPQFVSPELIPLREVKFDKKTNKQLDMFGMINECEGMCGI